MVGAAADYFFDRTWKAVLWSLSLAAIPIERSRVNRRSAEVAIDLLKENWNLVIFPEGGRSPDGWAQEFRAASAAYLAVRTGAPVVPVYLHGTRRILPKRGDDQAWCPTKPGGSGTENQGSAVLRRRARRSPSSSARRSCPTRGRETRHFGLPAHRALGPSRPSRPTRWPPRLPVDGAPHRRGAPRRLSSRPDTVSPRRARAPVPTRGVAAGHSGPSVPSRLGSTRSWPPTGRHPADRPRQGQSRPASD